MSGWSIFWAGLKGLVTPGTSMFASMFRNIAESALDTANSALDKWGAAAKVGPVCEKISAVLATLDRFADWCPDRYRAKYDSIRSVIGSLVTVMSDGRVDVDEAKTLIDKFRIEYAKWFAE